jgi:cellulose synthase/poly-beta-1,6-N-acetylglucosamine synthase-like glycosyltransferase
VISQLTESVLLPKELQRDVGFSIGVCAADHAVGVEELLRIVESEQYSGGLALDEVVIVASGIDEDTLAHICASANRRENVIIIVEPTRKGKAEAINRIIDRFRGDFLVLINSDARPAPGAISTLLEVIAKDRSIALVSASPMIADAGGMTGAVLKLMWEVHNECLATLNQTRQNNHCCDELVIIRSDALQKLPESTVNDGAFLAGVAHRAGYNIRFCEEARVSIDVPRRFSDLVRQRRRILYGHVQIMRSVGEPPRTLESMLFSDPKMALSILVRTLANFPRLILAFPVAIVGECVSILCAAADNLTPSKKHVPWERVAHKA